MTTAFNHEIFTKILTTNDLLPDEDMFKLNDYINKDLETTKSFILQLTKLLSSEDISHHITLLKLIEFVVEKSSFRFHSQVSSKQFISTLLNLLKLEDHKEIQRQTLLLIKKWGIKFESQKDVLPNFYNTYKALENNGITFPSYEIDNVKEENNNEHDIDMIRNQQNNNNQNQDQNLNDQVNQAPAQPPALPPVQNKDNSNEIEINKNKSQDLDNVKNQNDINNIKKPNAVPNNSNSNNNNNNNNNLDLDQQKKIIEESNQKSEPELIPDYTGNNYGEILLDLDPSHYKAMYYRFIKFLSELTPKIVLVNEIIDSKSKEKNDDIDDFLDEIINELRNGHNTLQENIELTLEDEDVAGVSLGLNEDILKTLNRYKALKNNGIVENFISSFKGEYKHLNKYKEKFKIKINEGGQVKYISDEVVGESNNDNYENRDRDYYRNVKLNDLRDKNKLEQLQMNNDRNILQADDLDEYNNNYNILGQDNGNGYVQGYNIKDIYGQNYNMNINQFGENQGHVEKYFQDNNMDIDNKNKNNKNNKNKNQDEPEDLYNYIDFGQVENKNDNKYRMNYNIYGNNNQNSAQNNYAPINKNDDDSFPVSNYIKDDTKKINKELSDEEEEDEDINMDQFSYKKEVESKAKGNIIKKGNNAKGGINDKSSNNVNNELDNLNDNIQLIHDEDEKINLNEGGDKGNEDNKLI